MEILGLSDAGPLTAYAVLWKVLFYMLLGEHLEHPCDLSYHHVCEKASIHYRGLDDFDGDRIAALGSGSECG